jgi:hypothetical protein
MLFVEVDVFSHRRRREAFGDTARSGLHVDAVNHCKERGFLLSFHLREICGDAALMIALRLIAFLGPMTHLAAIAAVPLLPFVGGRTFLAGACPSP